MLGSTPCQEALRHLEICSEQRRKHSDRTQSVVQSQGLHPGASLQWFPPQRWSTHPIADFLWMASQRPPCALPAFPLALPTQPLPLSPRSHLTLYGPVNFPETYFTEEKKRLYSLGFGSESLMSLLQHSLLMYILTSFSMNHSFLPHTLQDSLSLIQGPDLPTAASFLLIALSSHIFQSSPSQCSSCFSDHCQCHRLCPSSPQNGSQKSPLLVYLSHTIHHCNLPRAAWEPDFYLPDPKQATLCRR